MRMKMSMTLAAVVVLLSGVWTVSLAQEPQQVSISIGDFFFEGSGGRSGGPNDPVVNLATVKNGQPVQLFVTNSGARTHQIVTALLNAVPVSEVRILDSSDALLVRTNGKDVKFVELRPGWKVRIDFTPSFDLVDDGGKIVFDVSCHVAHGTANDHYLRGMKGTITVEK